MFKVINTKEGNEAIFLKASKKFELKEEDIKVVSFDKFMFSFVYFMALTDGKMYLLSTYNKKPDIFSLREVESIAVDKKTDLNLYLKNGRIMNLTSVVGIKPKVKAQITALNNEINKLR